MVLTMVSYISISLLGYVSSPNYDIHHQMLSAKGYHHQPVLHDSILYRLLSHKDIHHRLVLHDDILH